MTLSDHVRVEGRFHRSVQICDDMGDVDAVRGFTCPASILSTMVRMGRHIAEGGQGAFTWTGPYGGGKSSLAVALGAVLSSDVKLQSAARDAFGKTGVATLNRLLPPGKRGWRIVPIVGSREDPTKVLAQAFVDARLVAARRHWTGESLTKEVAQRAADVSGGHGGLLILVDEMGKFLEACGRDGKELYIFQQLAEVASRSGGRLVLIGILHQAFNDYARDFGSVRNEWEKLQGRFVDLVISVSNQELAGLVAASFKTTGRPRSFKPLVEAVCRRVTSDTHRLAASHLERCWPLHPLVVGLLGAVSRRKFGQNQRSVFVFLSSLEPYGFQDFLRSNQAGQLYGPTHLWDYLKANLEAAILASPDGYRWASAVEALERCERMGGDAIDQNILKTVAIIEMLHQGCGIAANKHILRLCVLEADGRVLAARLKILQDRALITYRKFADSYGIFAGSDFDIAASMAKHARDIDQLDFDALKAQTGLQPVLAKKHYHRTGALRWFDTHLVPLHSLRDFARSQSHKVGTIGSFVLAIPTQSEDLHEAASKCRECSASGGNGDIVVGLASNSWNLAATTRELLALQSVYDREPALQTDAVARKEVAARLVSLQQGLDTEVRNAMIGAIWYKQGEREGRTYTQTEVNTLASKLADKRFSMAPLIRSELVNRQRPSSNAIAARNELLKRMVQGRGRERLGIHGYPAEGGLFDCLLETTGLYQKKSGRWDFIEPAKDEDPAQLGPLWQAGIRLLEENKGRNVTVQELFDVWRNEPFGVKDGIQPVIAVAFLLTLQAKIAIYREGVFRTSFSDIDVQYLSKDPGIVEVRWMDLSFVARRLLKKMGGLAKLLDPNLKSPLKQPIEVARALISVYENVPAWSKRTASLSEKALRVRELFKRASDPNRFLFDDIPGLLETDIGCETDASIDRVVTLLSHGLKEIVGAYPAMLRRAGELMFRELRASSSSEEELGSLRERANNIRQLAGDFRLEAFVGRLSQFDGSHVAFEGVLSLAASKPTRDWVDLDQEKCMMELAALSRGFVRAELFAGVKGREPKRLSFALIVGNEGGDEPSSQEFSIGKGDLESIKKIMKALEAALDNITFKDRELALAALAKVASSLMRKTGLEQGDVKSEERVAL